MKQRVFPWIQSLSPPIDAPRKTVAGCANYGMAARIALAGKPGGPWSEAWLANRLHISRGYMSRILNDQQPMPEWMHRPISYATGSRLVEQYHAFESALVVEDARALIRRLALQLPQAVAA